MNLDFLKEKRTYVSAFLGLIVGFMLSFGFANCNKDTSVVIDQKQITDNTTRSETILVENLQKSLEESQLANKNLKNDLQKVLDDMDNLKAELKSYQVVKVVTPGKIVDNKPSDHVEPKDDLKPFDQSIDPLGYLTSTQTVFLFDKIGSQDVKIGSASFSGYLQNPWSYSILPKTYSLTTVIGETQDGKQVAYNTFEVEVDGKKIPVPIKSSILYQDKQLKNKFYFWNPIVGMSLSYGVDNNLSGNLGASVLLSPMSYGEKKTPTWLFGSIGPGILVDRNKTISPSLVVSPVQFNLGSINKFTNNTYIGPEVHTNFQRYSLQLGIRVNF